MFGGNFLHNFAIPMQIKVARSEDKIKVPKKYRFPLFKPILWYAAAKLIKDATGRLYQLPIKVEAYRDKLPDSSTGSEVGEYQRFFRLECW